MKAVSALVLLSSTQVLGQYIPLQYYSRWAWDPIRQQGDPFTNTPWGIPIIFPSPDGPEVRSSNVEAQYPQHPSSLGARFAPGIQAPEAGNRIERKASVDPWEYVGPHSPEHWPDEFPECDGRRQSPVDMDVYDMKLERLGNIVFTNYEKNSRVNCTITNNGHTAQVTFQGLEAFVSGGPLKGEFQLEQIHFHWGKHNNMGSEHTVARERMSMEMHAVHSNMDKSQGDYVVVSYMYEAVKEENHHSDDDILSQILDKASSVHINQSLQMHLNINDKGAEDLFGYIEDKSIKFESDVLESDGHLSDYCYYQGSLTTPPCSEIVTWIMTRKLRQVPETLLKKLRHLQAHHSHHNIVNNFRFPQPLHGRNVFCNKNTQPERSIRQLQFSIDPSSEEKVVIALKPMRLESLQMLQDILSVGTLRITEDDNLAMEIPESHVAGERLLNIQLNEGLVVISSQPTQPKTYELVILRNSDRLNFFESGENYILGDVIKGMEQLEKVFYSVRLEDVDITDDPKHHTFLHKL